MIPFGMLSDRIGPWKIMIAGLLVFILAPVLYSFASVPEHLIPMRLLHGLGSAMYIPAALSLVVHLSPPEKRGEATGWVVTMGQLGIMCGPLMGGFLLDLFDFRISFYTSSFVALLALIIALVLYKRTPHKSEGKTSGTVQISWGWLKQNIIIAALLIPLFLGLGVSNLNTFIPLYGAKNAIGEAQIGTIIAIYYASSAVLRVPFGRFTDRYGPRPIMVIGFLIFAIGMASFSLVNSFPFVSLVAAFFGLGFGIAFPAGLVIMANLAQPHMRGMAMAIYTSTFQIGVALGSSTMGFLADATSFERMFQISGIIMLVGVCAFYLLTRNRHKADFLSNDV